MNTARAGASERSTFVGSMTFVTNTDPTTAITATVHVVLCRENWQALDEDGEIVTKTAKHAWISSQSCGARTSTNAAIWRRVTVGDRELQPGRKAPRLPLRASLRQELNAMRGYHYLMRLAHLLNTLARFSSALVAQHLAIGARLHTPVRSTYSGPWLDPPTVKQRMERPFQLRFT
ncbi:MAG: hypothetical protein IPI02_08910 [Sterolibacteriaceae bacterium]|nr:hypothetical protein [Sterolibacteriaceae bacterium]